MGMALPGLAPASAPPVPLAGVKRPAAALGESGAGGEEGSAPKRPAVAVAAAAAVVAAPPHAPPTAPLPLVMAPALPPAAGGAKKFKVQLLKK